MQKHQLQAMAGQDPKHCGGILVRRAGQVTPQAGQRRQRRQDRKVIGDHSGQIGGPHARLTAILSLPCGINQRERGKSGKARRDDERRPTGAAFGVRLPDH